MISFDEFKELYALIPEEPEFDICLAQHPGDYMIIKYDDCVSFQRCGGSDCGGEFFYASLDELYRAELIDGILLERDWPTIEEIVVNSSWRLSFEDDIEDMKFTYRSGLLS